jgi:Holliday junction resolvase RusA-like endonuclease
MSVNNAWQGRRWKTSEYKAYEQEMMLLLPKLKIPEGKLRVDLKFGMSSRASDIDNPVKPFLDILQKKYGFDDKRIFKMIVEKIIVKKTDEYIEFRITQHN